MRQIDKYGILCEFEQHLSDVIPYETFILARYRLIVGLWPHDTIISYEHFVELWNDGKLEE